MKLSFLYSTIQSIFPSVMDALDNKPVFIRLKGLVR